MDKMRTKTVLITFSDGAWDSEIEDLIHMITQQAIVVTAEQIA